MKYRIYKIGKDNFKDRKNQFYEISNKERIIFYIGVFPLFFVIAYLFYKNVIISFFMSFFSLGVKGIYADYLTDKKKSIFLGQFKDWLYCISSSISVGRSMEWAIRDSEKAMNMMYGQSMILKEVRLMISAIDNMNMNSEQVIKAFAKKVDIEDVTDFADTYSICLSSGGNLKKAVLNIITILTDKMNIKREVKAIIAQRKFEGRVVAMMPLAILFLLNSVSPDYLEPMYTTVTGRVIMSVAMVSFIGAGLWIFKILNWK